MTRIEHGTISGYTSVYWSCRCEACTEAWKLYMRRYRARRPTRIEDTPEVNEQWARWHRSLTPEQRKERGMYQWTGD